MFARSVLFLFTASAAAQIPVGLDAYRMWDRWAYQRIGARWQGPLGPRVHSCVVNAITTIFPKQETCGLSQQMRRAAVSIPANIAEGFRRRGKADKARFMNMVEGSIEECRYYLILAKDLGRPDTQGLTTSLEEVRRLLGAYAAAILSSGS